MTPNNLVRMALIKGLELIAVTDHNTARQLPAVEKVCRETGVNLLPGIELTTREEVHLLAYFRTVEEALGFSDYVYPHLPDIPNRPGYFGSQLALDGEDELVNEEPRLLISALDISIDKLTGDIISRGGLAVPAHINRGSNGILNALGFLPPGAPYAALEISRAVPCPPDPSLGLYTHLHSSDAHRLEDIFERVEFLPLAEPTAQAFFGWLGSSCKTSQ